MSSIPPLAAGAQAFPAPPVPGLVPLSLPTGDLELRLPPAPVAAAGGASLPPALPAAAALDGGGVGMVASGAVPPETAGSRVVPWDEVQHVQGLIEHCMKEYMTQAEIISLLHAKAGVQPSLTCLVWKKLEEQNRDFFYAYNVMLRVKDQMVAFNYLAEQQTRVMQAHNLRLERPVVEGSGVGPDMPPLK
mmetsp:Transcript_5986/g.17503  ORF Transcript_5986/g.17503 Transcript_5986/m.17503 type:complete len:190 (-) Transcript_5986:154-723(-)